jgi:hypothetical protein
VKRLTAALLLALLVPACQSKPAAKPGAPVDVGGTALSRDGEPLSGYALRFKPDPADPNDFAMTSLVQKDGKFILKCRPGRYRVTLLRPAKGEADKERPEVAPQYFELTVPAGGKKNFVLQAE